MLISYPILLDGSDDQTEDAKLAAALAMELLDEGTYPVGHEGRWHGGIHINAGSEPIRAIADAEVVCYRLAEKLENYPGQGDIDTSFILLRHSTEVGENTPVVFYSLYMHLMNKSALDTSDLSQLPPFLRDAPASDAIVSPANQLIYRKEILGFAGMVYDRSNIFHFEIFTTEEHLGGFWRDSDIDARYGSSDIFGDSHFVVPPNQSFTARHPSAAAAGVHRLDFTGANDLILPVGTQGTSGEPLHVTVRLRQGRYRATSYLLVSGAAQQLGEPVEIDSYEYELYRQASMLYPDCPSAGYEWLRFGRVLGTDVTATQQNVKLIRYNETAMGYVNLAQESIRVRSDADFPRWQGWEKIDEGQTHRAEDGIADVPSLLALLGEAAGNQDQSLTPEEFAEYLRSRSNERIREKLRHLVVKHPTEWTNTQLETRYSRLREDGAPLQSAESWNNFARHVSALSFWGDTQLPTSVWHFHPLQFINHFRSCIWLSPTEFAQCIPRTSNAGNTPWNTALARANIHSRPYNNYIRKYCGASRARLLHNLTQSHQETGFFRVVDEGGQGYGMPYSAFFGRGYHQLTWAGNYLNYGIFCAIPNHEAPYSDGRITSTSQHAVDSGGSTMLWSPRYDPGILSSNLNHAAQSSGFYWVSKTFRRVSNMNRVADLPLNSQAVAFCSWLINGGGNGYLERIQYAKFIENVLLDAALRTGSHRFNYPPLTATLTATFPPTTVAYSAAGTVNYAAQRP